MLNRTNRMLSAKFDRLNLGTRSLVAPVAGIDMGAVTLHRRLDHPSSLRTDAMRLGSEAGCGGPPIRGYQPPASIPSSPPAGAAVAEAPPVEQEVVRDDRARPWRRASGAAATAPRSRPAAPTGDGPKPARFAGLRTRTGWTACARRGPRVVATATRPGAPAASGG